jgi:tetratricopeptide (TPR) repeat protein
MRFIVSISFALVAIPAVSDGQHHQLGTVHFPTTCSPAAQVEFERGVAMLHSYWFNYAGKTFRLALAQDPNCAMAYWGIALDLLGNTLASRPSAADAQAAWEALEKARAIDVKSERERDWLDAIRAYYRGYDTVPADTRLLAYAKAMQALAKKYPDDFEAQVFHALLLQSSAPKNDITYARQLESATLLERLYAQQPEHPGITHYLIHAYDYPPFAQKGIAAARRYAALAPAVPHARHMPAHIYSMVGMWEDSVESNRSALAIQPDYYHAADFIAYAQLQLAQDKAAAATIATAESTPERGDRPPSIVNFTALAAMPARYALERADWKGAATLKVTTSAYPQADSLTRFARGLGLARSANVTAAAAEIDAMRVLQAALEKTNDTYWADRTREQILSVSAWMARATGRDDEALALMRKAADGEDASVKSVAMENRLYPLRQLYAELLLEVEQPKAALMEFEKALAATPNRFQGIYGAASAAAAAGDRTRARVYYERLVALSAKADTVRPEMEQAREYLRRLPQQASTASAGERDPECFRPLAEFCATDKCQGYTARLATLRANRGSCQGAGSVGRCGSFRVLHQSDGFATETRYSDKTGTLVGVRTTSDFFGYPSACPNWKHYGVVPECQGRDFTQVCKS